ncbi:MAG: aminodeoxychorismate synthase component I, partial [Flavobacteriaceae bacterium]
FWENFPQSKEDYQKGFEIVQKNLKGGNSYLANYTCQTEIKTNLSLKEIYKISDAKYKVYYDDQFVFFSPETFVEIKENKIFTYPMKGTIDASVENAANVLKEDKKELAEHYTVVDLLRNDLSIVADNVQLEEFQRIDFIKTRQRDLYAMSSKISGELKPEFQGNIGDILQKLLPAGSILGAPKMKTLEIVLEAENYQRGFYTGVCGWFDGRNLDSCVMIRFIEKENKKFYFKSGGGITHMSQLEDEYQEMKNKIYVPIY